jgi:YesN/AraC family two-component response regulator
MIFQSKQINDIELAQNGFEGYNKILENNYDLVICDLNMPVMDGFRFCEKAVLHFKD